MKNPRHLRVYHLREDDMKSFFNMRSKMPDYVCVPHVAADCEDYSPPADAVVERVWYDYDRQSVAVLMSHESFEEVLPNSVICGYSAHTYMQAYKLQVEPVKA